MPSSHHLSRKALLVSLGFALPTPTAPADSIPCSQALGKNSLLTIAVKAEDAFLQTVQGHKADVLKHVQTGAALHGQALPLGLAREGNRAGARPWLL